MIYAGEFRIRQWMRAGVAGVVVSAVVAVAVAMAMAVSPILLDLESAGSRASGQISVTNPSAVALPVEVTYNRIQYAADGTYERVPAEDDFLVLPVQSSIPPGETQVFRVQYLGDPALAESRIYEFNFDQLPVAVAEGQTAMQIVYSIAAVVAVGPTGKTPQLEITGGAILKNEEGQPIPSFTIRNDGDRHGFISKGTLRMSQVDAEGRTIWSRTFSGLEISQNIGLGLVPPHQTRTFQAPNVLPSDQGEIRAEYRDGR